ncbi:P-loop containing nucleoside triphosphate hydrolase protein [Usnea florida]
MPQPRLVDTLPSTRTLPMKVIVLGLNRTGTMSMYAALQQLGYHPCHGTNMWEDPRKYLTLWTEAMRAKYMGEGEPWGRREFDVVLGKFDAVMDLPAACMVQELLTAYPTAHFILTTRPVTSWLSSMNATIIPTMTWRSWQLLRPFDSTFVAPWLAYKSIMYHGWGGGDFSDANLRRIFTAHEEFVKEVVPRERLLVYEVGEGWGPLCEFLGRERPGGGFPRVNDSGEYVRGFRRARDEVLWRVVGRGVVVLGVVLAVVAAWWWGV